MAPSVLIPALFCPPAGTATSPAASATGLLVTTRLMAFEGKWEVHLKAFKLDYCFQSDFNILSLSHTHTFYLTLSHTHTHIVYHAYPRQPKNIHFYCPLRNAHTYFVCVWALHFYVFRYKNKLLMICDRLTWRLTEIQLFRLLIKIVQMAKMFAFRCFLLIVAGGVRAAKLFVNRA